MNIVDWIFLGLAVLCFVIVLLLVARYWSKLKLLDLEAMPKAKLRSKKYGLIEDRLKRKRQDAVSEAKKVWSPVEKVFKDGFARMHDRIVYLEKKYRHADEAPQSQEDKEKTRQKIASLMEVGIQKMKEEEYAEAEEQFVDIVRIDTRNVEAYEYLGEVYLRKKEYDHAFEALEFAKKLNPNDDKIYYVLGQIYEDRDEQEKALDYYKQSVEIAPKSPRNLSALLELAITMENHLLARKTLNQLKEANPDNQKLEEFEERVTAI